MGMEYRNKNRGYQQLTVWVDAIEYYDLVCRVFRLLPYELKRVASQQMASTDSVHRNIAEGYCRRSLKEYIQFLYIALGSLGESVSGLMACRAAEQLAGADFDHLNALAYKLENGLLKLIASLEAKRERGDWVDHLMVRENNVDYDSEPITPSLQYSNPPEVFS